MLARATDVRAALVLTQGEERDATIVRAPNKSRGVITAHSVWAPLLMSAEVTSPTVRRSARARYGIRPPYAVGVRVSLSDLLLFEPYGQLPASLDEVIPHTMPTLARAREQEARVLLGGVRDEPDGRDDGHQRDRGAGGGGRADAGAAAEAGACVCGRRRSP